MHITSTRRCVLYARLSVSKEESVSIARQLRSCRMYAEARGWSVVGEFVDDGVSATANRPEERRGWRALLATNEFDAVIIWKVDRLARRVLDFLHADEALQGRGAGLVAVEDPIDMTTPQGRAFAVMLAVFGEMEAEATRARVRAARAQLLREGRWPGGGVPYGYRSIPNPAGPGQTLTKEAVTSSWLEEVVVMGLTGATVNSIATWLTRSGAPLPARKAARRDGDAAVWNRQTVDGMLRNPILAGMTPCNPGRPKSAKRVDPFAVVRDDAGDPVVNPDLAVIGVAEFAALQEMLNARRSPQARKRHERQATSPFLSRVARCDDCDVYLCRGTNQKRPVLYCPTCRQTIGRTALDLHLAERLLAETGSASSGGGTVVTRWRAAGTDDLARREVLLSQLESLRIRRGVVGRAFDEARVLLVWREPDASAAQGRRDEAGLVS